MLQVKPDRPLSPLLLALIRTLDGVAKGLSIPYFVIGATARDILMEHVHALETTRATRDIDFAVAVPSWDGFEEFKAQLISTGEFLPGEALHRLQFGEDIGAYPLDLVPFDGVAKNGEIAWPPDGDFIMNIAGYAEAYDSALVVELAPGFAVKIVSLPTMANLTDCTSTAPTFLRRSTTILNWLAPHYLDATPGATSRQTHAPRCTARWQTNGKPTNSSHRPNAHRPYRRAVRRYWSARSWLQFAADTRTPASTGIVCPSTASRIACPWASL